MQGLLGYPVMVSGLVSVPRGLCMLGALLIIGRLDALIDRRILSAYERFLDHFSDDTGAWRALPHEVSGWWRRRAESRLQRSGDQWRIVGPAAADGRIEFVEAV